MTDITNDNATTTFGNTYNICDVSGFRARPGELVRRWDGVWVLPEFWEPRHPQDFVRAKAERLTGSIRPESPDLFISTAVLASDL